MSVSHYRTKWAKVDNLGVVYKSLKVLSSWRLDRVYLEPCFFMYVQFMSTFDHSVMHWLNSGLKHVFWDITTGCTVSECMEMLPSKSAPPIHAARAQLFEL